jgi:penicillin amidase
VYSANNQPEPVDGYSYPGYWRSSKKNYTTLDSKSNWDKEAVSKLVDVSVSPRDC